MADMQFPENTIREEFGEAEHASLLRSYLGILRRRLWIILPVVIICGTLGLFKAIRTPPQFKAQAQLLVEKQAGNLDFSHAGRDTRWDPNFYTTQQQLMKGRVVMDIALRNESIREFLESKSDSGATSVLKEFQHTLKALLGIKPGPPDEIWKKLSATIEAIHIEDTDIFSLTVRSDNAVEAARIVNGVSQAFQTYHRERHVKNLGAEYEMFKVEKDRARQELLKTEAELQAFLEGASLFSATESDRDQPALKRLKRLNEELTEVNLDRIVLSSEISVFREAARAIPELSEGGLDKRLFSIPTIQTNTKLAATRKELSEAEKDLAMLQDTYGAQHPQLKSAEMKVGVLRDQFSRALQEISLQQENRLRQLQAQEKDLTDQLNFQNQEALELANEQFVYARLKSNFDRNTRVLDTLTKKMREADVARGLEKIRVEIIEMAEIPSRPETSAIILMIVFPLLFGLFSSCGLAFLFENLDDTIKTPEDLTDRLDVPLLGFIPAMEPEDTTADQDNKKAMGLGEAIRGATVSLRNRFPNALKQAALSPSMASASEPSDKDRHRRGTMVVSEPMSSITEAYRSVRTNLLYSMPSNEICLIAVSSCRPQEGKTTTCCNLALSLAQAGKSVLLIDADLHRPTVHKTFKITSDHGLTSVLVGETEWKETIVSPTIGDQVIENLDILIAGPSSPNPSELLGSKKMIETLDEIRDAYDIVIVDTPPALFVSDASILGTMCDGVILVVRSGDSTRSLLARAVDRLTSVHARIIGSILNGVMITKVGRYYSTYYHVGYSRYAKDYGRTYYATEGDEVDTHEPIASDLMEEEVDTPGVIANAVESDSDAKAHSPGATIDKTEETEQGDVDDENRIDRLQQDLNAEKALHERAVIQAGRTEEQLRHRIRQLESGSREPPGKPADPNSQTTHAELGDAYVNTLPDRSPEAFNSDAARQQALAEELEKRSAEIKEQVTHKEDTFKAQPAAAERKLQEINEARAQREQESAEQLDALKTQQETLASSVPGTSPGITNENPDAGLQHAAASSARGDFEEARATLQDIIASDPNQSEAWELYIDMLSLMNMQSALAECAVKLESLGSTKGHLRAAAWGHLAMTQGNLGIARNYFEDAYAQKPDCPFVLESLTKVDVQQDRVDDARKHTEKLLLLDPKNAFGHYVNAFLHVINRKPTEAEASLRESIRHGGTAEAHHDLAWLLNSRNDLDEAEHHASEAVRLNDRNPAMWDTLGLVLMNREKFADANNAFNCSLELNPENVSTLLNLTEIHAKLGNRPKALELDALLTNLQDKLSPSDRDRLGTIRDLVAQG